ncbi:hypothetical protein N7E81_10955 [Reichenbachiella carrageenanivorans]|uniref:Uncharacterized protein n=1 Tax=Reichenbachiella carrageenanivorans TaxID=2979869 RepID=A0ABY6CVF2_9BACT|nr:hypothetical protein [Reichenbachiella carrageenanivorans]UXX77886.1 hypothetical protein N7E81_10955 [Reichenbachiella carrageenanivorans]
MCYANKERRNESSGYRSAASLTDEERAVLKRVAEAEKRRSENEPPIEQQIDEFLAEFGHTRDSLSQATAERKAKEEQIRKANEKTPEQIQNEELARKEASKQAEERAGASKYYSKLKKDTLFKYGKKMPTLKLAFQDFESRMRSEDNDVGTRGFVNALEKEFIGLKWSAMVRGEEVKEVTASEASLRNDAHTKQVTPNNTQISEGVGAGAATNLKEDVLIIQQALHNLGLLTETDLINESEVVNNATTPYVEQDTIKKTIAAIEKFQREVLLWESYDGNICGPDSGTLKAMHAEGVTCEYVQKMVDNFPNIEAKRKAQVEADNKKKEANAKAEETKKAEAERIQCIKDEPATDQHIQENFIEQYENLDIFAETLVEYIEHNPNLVITILNSESVPDELSVKLLDSLTDTHLSGANDDILCTLQESLNRWYDWAFDKYEDEKTRIEKFVAVHQNENLSKAKEGEKRADIAVDAANNKKDTRKYRWNDADKNSGKGVDCSHFIREIDAVFHSEAAKKQKEKNGYLTQKELNKYCKTFSLERINKHGGSGTQRMVKVLKEHGTYSEKLEDIRIGDYVFTGSGKQKDLSSVSHVVIITKIKETNGKKRYYFAQSGKSGAAYNEETKEYEGGRVSVSNAKYSIDSDGGLWKDEDTGEYAHYFKGSGRP